LFFVIFCLNIPFRYALNFTITISIFFFEHIDVIDGKGSQGG